MADLPYTPTGADAVALARAVLAAGDTGHFVTSVDTALDSARVSVEHGARSMRERIIAEVVDILETHGTTDDLLNDVKRLRALPLLPDDTEGARTMRHCVLCASGDHQPSDHDAPHNPEES